MPEPIRLVCPDCDTVHRVRSVTLGKVYRCKKCKAGLVTLSPAVLVCPRCGASSEPTHAEVSRLLTCSECADAPLLELTFPKPETAATAPPAAGPPTAPAVDPAQLAALVRDAVTQAIGNITPQSLDLSAVEERLAGRLDEALEARLSQPIVDTQPDGTQIAEALRQELARTFAMRMGEFARILEEKSEHQTSNVQTIVDTAVGRRIEALTDIWKQERAATETALRDGFDLALAKHLGTLSTVQGQTVQITRDLDTRLTEALSALSERVAKQEDDLRQTLLKEMRALLDEQLVVWEKHAANDKASALENATAQVLQALDDMTQGADQRSQEMRRSLSQGLEEQLRAALSTLEEDLKAEEVSGATAVQAKLEAVADQLVQESAARESRLAESLNTEIQRYVDKRLTALEAQRAEQQRETVAAFQQTLTDTVARLADKEAEREARLRQAFADDVERCLLAQAEKLAEWNDERESQIAARVQQELDRVLASVPEGTSLSELRVDQLVGESVERALSDYDGNLQQRTAEQHEQLLARLQETIDQSLAAGLPDGGLDLEALRPILRETLDQGLGRADAQRQQDIRDAVREALAETAALTDQQRADLQSALCAHVDATLARQQQAAETAWTERDADLAQIRQSTESLQRELPQRLEEGLSRSLEQQVGGALDKALVTLPSALESKVVEPLGRQLQDKVPEMLSGLQEDEIARTFGSIAQENQAALVSEVRSGHRATVAWISRLVLPMMALLLVPVAVIFWVQVRGLGRSSAASPTGLGQQVKALTGVLTGLETHLIQQQEEMQQMRQEIARVQQDTDLLARKHRAKIQALEETNRKLEEHRQTLVEQIRELSFGKEALTKGVTARDVSIQKLEQGIADRDEALKKWQTNVEKWQKLAQDNYDQVQRLKRQLRELGHEPDADSQTRKPPDRKDEPPRWP